MKCSGKEPCRTGYICEFSLSGSMDDGLCVPMYPGALLPPIIDPGSPKANQLTPKSGIEYDHLGLDGLEPKSSDTLLEPPNSNHAEVDEPRTLLPAGG